MRHAFRSQSNVSRYGPILPNVVISLIAFNSRSLRSPIVYLIMLNRSIIIRILFGLVECAPKSTQFRLNLIRIVKVKTTADLIG